MRKTMLAIAALTLVVPAARAQVTIGFQSFEGDQTVATGFGAGELNVQQQILELDLNGDGSVTAADSTGESLVFDSNGDGTLDANNPVYAFLPTAQVFDDTDDPDNPGNPIGLVPNPSGGTGTGRVFDATNGSIPWVMKVGASRLGPDALDAGVEAMELADEAFIFENTGINVDLTYVRNVAVWNEQNHFGPVSGFQYDGNTFVDSEVVGADGNILVDGEGMPILDDSIPGGVINQTPGPNFGVVFDYTGPQVINGVSGEGADAFGVSNAERLGGTFGGSPAFIPDGDNVFYVEDPDNSIFLDFASVDLGGFEDPELRFDLVTNGTGYEEFDRVAVLVNGVEVLGEFEGAFELGDEPDPVTGQVDELETVSFVEEFERQYIDLSQFAGQTVDLRFRFDYSAGSEEGAVDNIRIVGFDSDAIDGDLNADGLIDGADFDLLHEAAVYGNGLTNSQLDINGDGQLDFASDVEALAALAGTVVGDANGDGAVASDDLSAVAGGFSQSATFGADGPYLPKYSEGDFNGDGIVDALDVSVVSSVFGFQSAPALAVAVPEPGTLVFAVGAVLATACRRRA